MVDSISSSSPAAIEQKRDAYGFALRPQHLQRYKQYHKIYKEEEGERIQRWDDFLLRPLEFLKSRENKLSANTTCGEEIFEDSPHIFTKNDTKCDENGDVLVQKEGNFISNTILPKIELCVEKGEIWTDIRPSIKAIEDMLSTCAKEKSNTHVNHLTSTEEVRHGKGGSDDESEEEFYDMEKYESPPDASSSDDLTIFVNSDDVSSKSPFAWNEELECLIRGGVPMALRGELWQAFVGTRARRRHSNYYKDLLSEDAKSDTNTDQSSLREDSDDGLSEDSLYIIEKWKGQIEKDIPRTFPGHPALDENGRNALRRILTAYARHNPSVGYCQAMNFFAGFLLLLMPEENAFWTLVGIIDEYFDGYYSEEMIESQVDQLVFVELVQEKFPKLVSHLDYLGVQVAWVTGPWFLSIFMNMLPWESVLRVWDVLLFERNRVMLFRTALALMELYGPALVTAKDAGDAITLLQSLAGSTFDSSQLVLIACMGYQNVNEGKLQEMREKHRPSVILAIEERLKGLKAFRDSKGLASKLFSFKHDARSMADTPDSKVTMAGWEGDIVNAVPDIQEQAVLLKVELCRLLEDKRSAILRANELEAALTEMVKQDNRRELISKVETLEKDILELHKSLADKQDKEHKMIQVLMRVEQSQKATEDARRFSEQDATAQRFAAQVLQEKYEAAITSLAEMEKRVVMAESTLEATLQYHSGQTKAQSSPRIMGDSDEQSNEAQVKKETPAHPTTRKAGLLRRQFGFGLLDRNNKEKMAKEDESRWE